MKYAFFDMDGTLTRGDTFTGFIRHVRGFGGLLRVLFLSAPAILLWKCGFRSNVYAKLRMFSVAFKGASLQQFRRAGEAYAASIDRMARREVVEELDKAVASGAKTAIVSASLGDWIRPWAHAHGVDMVLATEPEIDSAGKLTGAFRLPNCEKEEKVRRILEAFPELQEERGRHLVTAYGDSSNDEQMLRFADRGVRVGKR